VWRSEIDGLRLSFHLAGINNQNFLMRDDQTGTYWQQISGAAVSGPLAGRHLTLVPSDELTFALWRAENPRGTVLGDVPAFVSEYAKEDWDVRMRRAPTVLNYPEHGLAARDLMLGIDAFGASRAFRYDDVVKAKVVEDHVGSEPVLLVTGPDGQSVRAFRRSIPGAAGVPEFYRIQNAQPRPLDAILMDDATGSGWDFGGCAISGKARGSCLGRIEVIKDYWFDWRHYHPRTTVYPAQHNDARPVRLHLPQ
jgi:Protein of unknown function (DUF3179)